ncbi:hypothetical protein LZ906_004390 [Paraclostridium ghonii]|uniref:hypothetical protein n=1 Tax=Paraclostridium ghonii TaxID=29358 RepID=UPI0030486730|nr:hypothetical protein [Paeniclostridium ghonii]
MISIVGLFLPWFFFDSDIDYTNGLVWLSSPLLSTGILSSIFLIFIKKRSKVVNIANFISLLLIPLSCIYLFFSWHIMTITGELDILVSFSTAHYGFYVTTISSLIATVLYSLNMSKIKSKTINS